jgi:hypothetical protein
MPPVRFSALALLVAVGCARPRLDLPGPEALPGPPAGMSRDAWVQAHAAFRRVSQEGLAIRPLLAIIDYSLPSTERRLWVVNPGTDEVIATDFVAHGWASGGTWASDFSNRAGSNRSSLGAFVTGEAYWGTRGLSLRLRGLEPGINDRALARGLVIHGSPFVSGTRASLGHQGRTEGCPAVPMGSARALIPLLQGGAVVFVWYPDPYFLTHSAYLDRFATTLSISGS